MYMFPYVCAVCTEAGRFDGSMLGDQDRMDLLYTPTSPEDSRLELSGDPGNACTWSGVKCDSDDRVRNIDWIGNECALDGSITFEMLPRQLHYLMFLEQKLTGEIDTSDLPEAIEFFWLQNCLFTGTVDLCHLPPKLRTFLVLNNNISGVTNVCNLPMKLQKCTVCDRIIVEDSLYVGRLPETDLEIQFCDCSIHKIVFENPEDEKRVYVG